MAISCVSQFMQCRMRSFILYGLVLLLFAKSISCQDEETTTLDPNDTTVGNDDDGSDVTAPSPGGDRDEEDDIGPIYDIYVNTSINICANVADGVNLPYVGNCDMYVECINGTYEIGSCWDEEMKTHELCKNDPSCEIGFDYEFQVCTNREEVNCLPTCEEYELSSFCYDNTCTKYVLCYFGYPVLRECPDGLQYNNETDRCDFPQHVDCVANYCSNWDQPENIIYLPSKAHCNKYYICSNGKAWGQECSNGLLYNPKIKSCDFQKNVNCTIEATQRNIQPYSRRPPRRADITCPARGIHFIEHNRRRDAYYYCVNGRGVTLDCTPGLYYDPKIQECRESQYIYA
ncbi:uncharacterized protein Dwil_GK17094 [Drosophila willistoni]|uniref:Chitin-binding type-2 domain-containing protein n=1 Tax=Drosophila willistoni TaxID=7260 RepID=B4MNA5_DROWI|nr:uncharacterized protein Dwil_GK17094 [Drosophila willistoni]